MACLTVGASEAAACQAEELFGGQRPGELPNRSSGSCALPCGRLDATKHCILRAILSVFSAHPGERGRGRGLSRRAGEQRFGAAGSEPCGGVEEVPARAGHPGENEHRPSQLHTTNHGEFVLCLRSKSRQNDLDSVPAHGHGGALSAPRLSGRCVMGRWAIAAAGRPGVHEEEHEIARAASPGTGVAMQRPTSCARRALVPLSPMRKQ